MNALGLQGSNMLNQENLTSKSTAIVAASADETQGDVQLAVQL